MGVISAEDYNQTLSKIENKKREQMFDFIKGMPYFRSMNALKVKSLINSLQKVEYSRGHIVINEKNLHQSDVFFVLEGEFAEI